MQNLSVLLKKNRNGLIIKNLPIILFSIKRLEKWFPAKLAECKFLIYVKSVLKRIKNTFEFESKVLAEYKILIR